MFKVILAEDELIFRKYLVNLIDWKTYGFEICGEAKNGIEALELSEHIKPDVALIDINMPIMDGLLLSEKLKEKYKDICIILITGYNEFEYARKAIKIGIEDYIVKPFDENEMLATLIKVKGKLQKQRDENIIKGKNFSFIRESKLNILLQGGYIESDEIIRKHDEHLNIDFNEWSFIVSTIEIDNIYSKWRNVDEIIECKYSVCNIVEDFIKVKEGFHIVFNGPENRIISIIGFHDNAEIEDFINKKYNDVIMFFRKYFDFTVTIGIGISVSGFKFIRDSYLKSLDALRYQVVSEIGNVMKYSKIKFDSMNLGFYPNEVNEKLIMYLRLNDFENIKQELDNIFNSLSERKLSLDYIYAIIMGLKSVCLAHITQMGKNIEDVLGKDFSPMQIITNRTPIEMANKLIIELFEKTVSYFSCDKITKAKVIAEFVKNYIDENYKDNKLNLEKIAKNIFLNPEYIRKVFKKELNVTVTDYITSVRMKKAKELLDAGNNKFSSLCYDVGYNDVSYFSKCFKKYYGLSPRDYKNMKN